MKMWKTMAAAAALSVSALATAPAQAAENAAAAPDATAQDPGKLVQGVAEAMLKDLDANRAAYKQDPSKIDALVDKHLLPHFDTPYAAQLVLGKNWRTASPEQRKRFIDAFYKSLLHNYGTALADFTGDRLKVLPANVDPGSDRATVRTFVKRSNGQQVPVNYSMRKADGEWKAWDVVIEGISYVKSFREDFGAEIDQRGLDAVIERIEKGGKPVVDQPASKST